MPDAPLHTNDLSVAQPLVPPRDAIPEPFLEAYGWAIPPLLGLVVILIGLWIAWKRRPKHVVIPGPAAQARHDLGHVRGNAPDAVVAAEVARVIRRFLTAMLHVESVELTTTELCALLSDVPEPFTGAANFAADFLQRCDAIRFAPHKPELHSDLLADGYHVIEHFENAGVKGSGPSTAFGGVNPPHVEGTSEPPGSKAAS